MIATMDRRQARSLGTVRVMRIRDDDGQADRAFWRGIAPEERFGMVWEMVLEHAAWKGIRDDQLRLQRSVCRLERGGR